MNATLSGAGRSRASARLTVASNPARSFSQISLTRFGSRSRWLDDGVIVPAAFSNSAASADGTAAMNAAAVSAAASVQ